MAMSKRSAARTDYVAAPPSRVVHVRGLPADCLEHELAQAAAPFGQLTNILVMRGKNQGFLEFASLESARQLVEFSNSPQAPPFRGFYHVYYQYSNRNEITSNRSSQAPNHILLVSVLNVCVPITIDLMLQIFGRYGTVTKIILFIGKSGTTQCLIQYAETVAAQVAKQQLEGQNLSYCTFRIQFSTLTDLNVKFNNERSRDLMQPFLPSGPSQFVVDGSEQPAHHSPAPFGVPLQYGVHPQSLVRPGLPPLLSGGMSLPSVAGDRTVIIISNLSSEVTPDHLFTLCGVYGDVLRVKIMYNRKDLALVQFTTPDQASRAIRHLNHCPLFGQPLSVNISSFSYIRGPSQDAQNSASDLTRDYTGSPLHRFKYPGSKNHKHVCNPSNVLHISNIPDSITDSTLTSLFGRYGTVTHFKFFEPKNQEAPPAAGAGTGAAAPGSSATGGGAPASSSSSSSPPRRKMALLQLGDIDEAVRALVFLHNHRLDDSNIKVSFSKVALT